MVYALCIIEKEYANSYNNNICDTAIYQYITHQLNHNNDTSARQVLVDCTFRFLVPTGCVLPVP